MAQSGHLFRGSNPLTCRPAFRRLYSCQGYLLCHDDELEGRRIAYIFYLVDEGWSMDDGGRLELFDMCVRC